MLGSEIARDFLAMREYLVLPLLPLFLLATGAALGAAPASAPPQVMSDPEPNALVQAPVYMLHVMFPNPVDAKSVRMDVTAKDGKPIVVGEVMPMGIDGKTMMAMPKEPMPAGGYTVKWRAAGADGKELQGEFSFTAQ
jgi:methionine-rich copper-binding protein CopC